MTSAVPTLRHERQLLRDGARLVIGCDEVGRGAIAGPVGVG
jgi:ribonuclease HII